MRPAACCRGSFPRDTSAKPGTNRIQSRALQANANSHRHRSFQNSADSAAMSSLHPAFFTLSVHFTNLAVSNYGLLDLAMEWKAPTYTRGLAPHQSLVVYPISLYPLKPFDQCVPSCGETPNTTWNGVYRRSLGVSVSSTEDLVGRGGEQAPNAVYPVEMLRLHEHRTQASNRFAIALCRSQVLLPKTNRQFRYRQMQIAPGRSFEYLAAQNRSLADAPGFRHKYDNVEFREQGGYKPHILAQLSEKRQRRLPSAFQPAREFASLFQRQQSLRGPQGRRRRPRTGALQAYLAQVQLRGAEIGVGRIVLVQSAHSGIAKEHAAAPVGLPSVFVRIDDNRVRFSNLCNGPLRIFSKIFRKHEIAAVGGIGVNPESVLCAQSENLRQRIHRTCRRGTYRRDNRPHVAALRALRQRIHVHPAPRIARHAFEWQLQNTADPPVRIVSLFAGENFLSRLQLAGHP